MIATWNTAAGISPENFCAQFDTSNSGSSTEGATGGTAETPSYQNVIASDFCDTNADFCKDGKVDTSLLCPRFADF